MIVGAYEKIDGQGEKTRVFVVVEHLVAEEPPRAIGSRPPNIMDLKPQYRVEEFEQEVDPAELDDVLEMWRGIAERNRRDARRHPQSAKVFDEILETAERPAAARAPNYGLRLLGAGGFLMALGAGGGMLWRWWFG